MSELRLLAFGHSHLAALQSGYNQLKASNDTPFDVRFKQLWGLPFFREEPGESIYNDDMEAELISLAGDADGIVTTLIGSEPFIWAVTGQARPFDIILPFSPNLAKVPGAEIIPYGLLRRWAYDTISGVLDFHARIRSLTGLPIYQVLPPPPVANEDSVLKDASDEFREIMQTRGIPHWAIRYKLWLLWVSIAEEMAGRNKVQVVPSPSAASDENGLLLEEYSGDCVHANQHFGCLVWRQLEPLISAKADRIVSASV